jgi:hypothetical protein
MELSGELHFAASLFPEKEFPVPMKQEAGWIPVLMYTLEIREEYIASIWNRTTVSRVQNP